MRVDDLELPVDAGGIATLKRSFVMELIVRGVDVGFGNTKFIAGVAGGDIRCASIPSLAYPSARDPATLPAAERRKTMAIPINGLYYEVGQDVALATDNLRATHLHDRYTETPGYTALLRGALALMKIPSIDLLVVGLPVSHFMGKKAALEKAVTGTHDVGGGKAVIVRKALVVAQPQGALVYYAATHQKLATIEHEQSLPIFNEQEPDGLSEGLRHLAADADGELRSGTRGRRDARKHPGRLQLPEHHPRRGWSVLVQGCGEAGISEAPHPGSQGADVRQCARVPIAGMNYARSVMEPASGTGRVARNAKVIATVVKSTGQARKSSTPAATYERFRCLSATMLNASPRLVAKSSRAHWASARFRSSK